MKLQRAGDIVMFWCPGCDEAHGINGTWQLTGPEDSPTIRPSLRVFDAKGTRCHLFLTNGKLEFLADCLHSLSGKTVPLPDWPYGSQA